MFLINRAFSINSLRTLYSRLNYSPARCLIIGRTLANNSAQTINVSDSKRQQNADEEEESNEPIPYSTSPANKWKVSYSYQGRADDDRLWYEPLVVMGSLAVFMIYFCILREENDIDDKFDNNLHDVFKNVEREHLIKTIEENKKNNLSTREMEIRLNELNANMNE